MKVTTWNVENLFLPVDDASDEKKKAFEDKLELLTNVVEKIDPDVIALQEIGTEESLTALQDSLGGSHSASSIGVPDGRGIRVAFLSKHAVVEKEDIVDFPSGPALLTFSIDNDGQPVPITRMGRGALRIRVKVGGKQVDLINAHLKSKLLTFPPPGKWAPKDEAERAQVGGIALHRRTAEATTLRLRVNGVLVGNEKTPLVLLGDLNDVPEAQTSLLLNGPPGSEIGTGGFHRDDKGDDARLFNLAPLIPKERRYSRVFKGRGELLDQILVSEELLTKGVDGKRSLPSVDSMIDFVDEGLPSISDDPSSRAKEVAPDHSPVSAEFEF